MEQLDYIVVPVTQLKQRSKTVMEALAGEKRVFVAKHGRIVAAIDPFRLVPHDVVTAFSAPKKYRAHFSAISARVDGPYRALGRGCGRQ